MLLIGIILILIAAGTSIASQFVEIGLQATKYLDNSGQVVSTLLVKFPLLYLALLAFSAILDTVAVALIVAAVVEGRLLQKEFDEQQNKLATLHENILKDVHAGVFRTMINEEVYSTIVDSILRSATLKKDLIVAYDFRFDDRDVGKIELRSFIEYKAYNISGGPEVENLSVRFGGAIDTHDQLQSFTCTDPSGNQLAIFDNLDPSKNKNVDVKNSTGISEVSCRVPIAAKSFVHVQKKLLSVYTDEVEDAYFSQKSCVNLRVQATFPAGCTFLLDSISPK
jgi:hypothetical protein